MHSSPVGLLWSRKICSSKAKILRGQHHPNSPGTILALSVVLCVTRHLRHYSRKIHSVTFPSLQNGE